MQALNLIAKKRDGQSLTDGEIQSLVTGFARGDIPDYQVAAWLMAVYLRGMSPAETAALTLAMAHSGQVLDLGDVKRALSNVPAFERSNVPTLIADKHSTGGVGDKTTIAVAPLVAACGVAVAKMSGRGLGHTGGTLDKLEAIPGFSSALSITQFKQQLSEIGLVLAGQTHDLAPADGRLYALRDVTATVASMPLIASSIMSKKIAAGADAIVLDVKVGWGAFMQREEDALALARTMVEIGQSIGRRVSAVIADMNQPLGTTVGNALEVMEAILAITPRAHVQTFERSNGLTLGQDFRGHCLTVASEMLQLVGRASDDAAARALLEAAIESGRALEKFRAWIAAQGGDPRVADEQPARGERSLLPRAQFVVDVPAPRDGYVSALDALEVGLSAMRLGAGRIKKGDAIDHAVGIVLHKKIGDGVQRGEPLFTIHANDDIKINAERDELLGAYEWSDSPIIPPDHVHHIIR